MTLRYLMRGVLTGAFADLGVFLVSFLFSSGPHGPAGPFFVLYTLNGLLANVVMPFFAPERTSTAIALLATVAIVTVNGGLYGALVAIIVLIAGRVGKRR